MPSVLIASSRNWMGVARLPSTLSAAGISVDLLDRGGTMAAASSRVRAHIAVAGTAEDVAERLMEMAPRYDRALACDEPLLSALCATGDPRATSVLPARPDVLGVLLDKTTFPAAAAAAGLRVPRSVVVGRVDEVPAVFDSFGSPVIVKGRHGFGGNAVRSAETTAEAAAAVRAVGLPALIEERVSGLVALMPCLFERGEVVGAFAADKLRTAGPFGPSTINRLRPVGPGLLEVARLAGLAFGLHGFASIDFFEPAGGGAPIVIELNLRPVPQLHVGRRVGVDMAALLRDVLSKRFDGITRCGRAGPSVILFPQELQRLRSEHRAVGGTMRWLGMRGAAADVPWGDASLAWRHLSRRD